MQIVIDNITIIADGYTPIPKELSVQFYRNKSSLDYIPPIKVDAHLLSDFGNSFFWQKEHKSEVKE